MKDDKIPIWKRYALTVTEAAEYYHIGENKLRRIAEKHSDANFIILNGNRVLFKRQQFEKYLDKATTV
jgi:excisionase